MEKWINYNDLMDLAKAMLKDAKQEVANAKCTNPYERFTAQGAALAYLDAAGRIRDLAIQLPNMEKNVP